MARRTETTRLALRGALRLLPLLLLASCTAASTTSLYSLSYPTAFALVCQAGGEGNWQAVPLAECTPGEGGHRLLAVVANGPTGDVGFIDLTDGDAQDMDRMVPGYTRLYLGGYLADLAASPDSRMVYALDTVGRRLVLLDPATADFDAVDLPFVAGRVEVTPAGDALLLTLPGDGAVARMPLDGDGNPGEPEIVVLGGSPSSIAFSDDGALLVVAHMDEPYLSVLAPDALTETFRIGLVAACADGLDNDGDGLADRDDPGCLDHDDRSEEDPLLCPEPRDPGTEGDEEAGTEGEDTPDAPGDCLAADSLPSCANGLDDDGDGLTDLDDPGCRNRADWTEDTDALELPEGTVLPIACANGLDDDGDGLVDYPEDPDCFAAGDGRERGLPLPASEVAVSADGRHAYVTHQGLLQVMAVDLEAAALVDVNALDDGLERQLKYREGTLGIDFGYVPRGVRFHKVEDRLYAYVGDLGGRSSRVLVEDAGQPVHQADSATEEDDRTSAGKPRLYVDDDEIQLGYTPISGYPNIGPLLVETLDEEAGTKRYYGVEFLGDLRAHRNETWTVAYEGQLPGTEGLKARYLQGGRILVTGGDLCSRGVLPGDALVFEYDAQQSCGNLETEGVYNFLIASVGADEVELAAEGGWTTDAEGERVELDLPDADCLEELFAFAIRPVDTFVVTGSRSGFLHNVVPSADGCVESADASPLFNGRAYAATLKEGETLHTCPVTEPHHSLEMRTFENPIFRFDVYPACSELADGTREVITSSRETEWRFSVASGFVSQTILAAKMASDQALSPQEDLLYVLDLAGRSIKEVALDEFVLQASYY